MNAISKMIDRLWQMPRAGRWLVLAIAFIVAFVVWDNVVRPTASSWKTEADKIKGMVRTVQNAPRIQRDLRLMQDTIMGLGTIERPRSVDEGIDAMSDAVVEVLEQHDVKKDNFDLVGVVGPLPRDVSRKLASSRQKRLKLITGRLRFEAEPEVAIQVIADLERRPELESIDDLTIDRSDKSGRTLSVVLTVESWVEDGGSS